MADTLWRLPFANIAEDHAGLAAKDGQGWCDPWRLGFDCMSEAACGSCGNDLDTLCPLLALPGMVAVLRAASQAASASPAPSSPGRSPTRAPADGSSRQG